MRSAATQSYLPKSKMDYLKSKIKGDKPQMSAAESEEVAAKEVDANILHISLGSLENVGSYATGDPFQCTACRCFFNVFSKASVVKEGIDTFWNCEFCKAKNKLTLEEPAYPATDTVTYIMAPAPPAAPMEAQPVPVAGAEPMEEIKGAAAETPAPTMVPKQDELTVIFCIDNSGSMDDSVTMPVAKGMKYVKHKGRISRLEAVKLAIDSQIVKMVKDTPGRKIGFVVFEDQVLLIGDGMKPPVTLDQKYCNDFHGMVEHVSDYNHDYMSKPIKETASSLLEKLSDINTGGCTSLGPALVASVALASKGAPGSKVIICTDGLANRGMGSIESGAGEEVTKKFYNDVGQYAQAHNIVVSVISLVASECRLDLLSPIADLTGGDVLRVNPANLSTDFSSLLSEQVVATQVSVKVRLHKIMQFTGVPEQYLSENGTIYLQDVGSATRESVVTCRYTMKPVAKLEEMKDIDFETIGKIPLQLQVDYRALDGKKCMKIITQFVRCTEEFKEAKKGLDKDVVKSATTQATVKFAKAGRYAEAMQQVAVLSSLPEDMAEQQELQAHMQAITTSITKQQVSGAAHQTDDLSSKINQIMKKS